MEPVGTNVWADRGLLYKGAFYTGVVLCAPFVGAYKLAEWGGPFLWDVTKKVAAFAFENFCSLVSWTATHTFRLIAKIAELTYDHTLIPMGKANAMIASFLWKNAVVP